MVLEKINSTIKEYTERGRQMSSEELQEVRDELSTSLYYLADYYSEVRGASDSASYERKICSAKVAESYRSQKQPNGKPYTRDMVNDRIVLDCAELVGKENNCLKEYYRIKLITESLSQLLNTISSAIKLLD